MSAVASPRRHNDENKIPASNKQQQHHNHHHHHHRDAFFSQQQQPSSTSPRHRQPLAALDNPPNLYSSRYPPGTPAHASGGTANAPGGQHSQHHHQQPDVTPVRGIATKVDPDARELPLPKGLVFAPPPPPAASLYPPLPTPTHSRTAPSSRQQQHPPPLHAHSPHHGMHHHSMGGPGPMGQTPRGSGGMTHPQNTPARSMAGSYSSPSTMSHMPSTPDMRSPYPVGHVIELHELLPPARFPGPLPAAYVNQGDMPTGDGNNDDNGETPSSTSTRRALVSCNPWDYRPEDHGKNKPRRRFSPGELDMLEILWSISHNPHKWQRQKLARWFGCTTRHLTVWFQNRRQDLKKAETLVQMAESNPDTASRALAAVNRANRGDQLKFSPEQTQVIMDIVSDRVLPEMWFSQQPSGSSPTPGHRGTPSPPSLNAHLGDRRMAAPPFTPAPPAIAPKPLHPSHHTGPVFALKPVRRGYSLDDVCTDREMSMKHRTPRARQYVDGFEQMHKNDPRYREALINMLPSELSSDAIEPPEDDDESAVDADSPTRKRARHSTEMRAPRPTLPSIGLGRPPIGGGHRPRSSFGRASSSDVLACSSRARYLANNPSIASRAVTDPVPSRSVSAGPMAHPPPVPEHREQQRGSARAVSTRLPSLSAVADLPRKRKMSRQGSWSHLPSLKHRDSFDRGARVEPSIKEGSSSPVPGQTRSPTPTETESISPRSEDAKDNASAAGDKDVKPRLPVPEGRSIYSFSTELEPETKRGTAEMDENVLTGAHALMELFRGR